MNENLKKFLEKVSEDKALAEKVSAEKDPAALIPLAKEMGIELNEADLKKPVEELSDDELDTVAGGGDVSCACAMGGGGTKDANDKTCACVLAGVGYAKDKSERCLCGFAGYGYDT
jgi:predicted ribosomally synthesized peptide with nif11-like leader